MADCTLTPTTFAVKSVVSRVRGRRAVPWTSSAPGDMRTGPGGANYTAARVYICALSVSACISGS